MEGGGSHFTPEPRAGKQGGGELGQMLEECSQAL